MALPLIPIVGSMLGSLIPFIVDAFRSSSTPEEAQKKVQPKYDEMVQLLIGGGMNEDAAHKAAEEFIKPEMEKALEAEPMNPLLSMGLSVLGGYGGFKGGAMLAKGLSGKLGKGVKAALPTPKPAAKEPLRLGHKDRVDRDDMPEQTYDTFPDVDPSKYGTKKGMDVIHAHQGDERQVGVPRSSLREVKADKVSTTPENPFPERNPQRDLEQNLDSVLGERAAFQSKGGAPSSPFPSSGGYLPDEPVGPPAVKVGKFPKRAPAQGGVGQTVEDLVAAGLTEEEAIEEIAKASKNEFGGVTAL